MKINIKVSNLGKIKDASIKVRPITLLTGPNGTGKSFLTKSLYSILNVINTNAHHLSITDSIARCHLYLDSFRSRISYPSSNDHSNILAAKQSLDMLQALLNKAAEQELQVYFDYTKSRVSDVENIQSKFDGYLDSLSGKKTKKASIKTHSKNIKKELDLLTEKLEKGMDNYVSSLKKNLDNEVKDNFQISDISQLISFGEDKTVIEMDDLVNITYNKKVGAGFSLRHDFIDKISLLSRVVFFESPAYWKVRDALKSAKTKSEFPFYFSKNSNNILTGVPKYFYDLDSALNLHVKNRGATEVEDLTVDIEKELGGEFVFNNDELVFKDFNTKKEIPKNLISFGMTNLGMINALLKNNVITPGSFVFIDEPETNLHPQWQVLLMNVLIKLAQRNVTIVIATHSIDMIKALEVGLKELEGQDEDFMSVHYLDIDGKLLNFESDIARHQLAEARNELSSSYEALFFKG